MTRQPPEPFDPLAAVLRHTQTEDEMEHGSSLGRNGRFDEPVEESGASVAARADEWQPIETAPKDGTPMLWGGRYRPFDILPGGEWATVIVHWGSFMSDGTGEHWVGGPEGFNVDWTHWRPLPDPPALASEANP